MITVSARSKGHISFVIVKTLLTYWNITPDGAPEHGIARGLRIIYPLDQALAHRVRTGETSLTDAASPEEQIRFFQHQRAHRSYVQVAQWLQSVVAPISLTVTEAEHVSDADRDFLVAASRTAGWDVAWLYSPRADALTHLPSGREARIAEALVTPTAAASVAELVEAGFEYINAGDAWPARAIGTTVAAVERSPRVWNLLALSCVMLDRTVEAERYYTHWSESGTAVDSVRALYGQAMLYARHHPPFLRDLDRSAELLERAHGLLHEVDADLRGTDAVTFDEVFNRNGYALILFRRGEVSAAIDLLEWGIATLTSTGEKVAIHRTVLIYNLAQCFKQLGRLDEAIETYERLLRVDPHMPEYHLEFAKCLGAAGDLDAAVAACRETLKRDDTPSAAWSLLGLYLGRSEDFLGAAAAYGSAYLNDGSTPGPLLDAAYFLLRGGELSEAEDVLRRASTAVAEPRHVERLSLLTAEALVRRDRVREAISTLEDALPLVPGSRSIRSNMELLGSRT